METYNVRVAGDRLNFSAAHFISFDAETCEPLHGHDYRVSVEIEGRLNENQYVVDFCLLEEQIAEILERLDHRTLLPDGSGNIHIDADGERVEVRFNRRVWQIPRDDCVFLPVANTTSECIALYVAEELLKRLRETLAAEELPSSIKVELTESPGRTAGCRISPR